MLHLERSRQVPLFRHLRDDERRVVVDRRSLFQELAHLKPRFEIASDDCLKGIEAEREGLVDAQPRVDPFEDVRIAEGGDVPEAIQVPRSNADRGLQELFYRLLGANVEHLPIRVRFKHLVEALNQCRRLSTPRACPDEHRTSLRHSAIQDGIGSAEHAIEELKRNARRRLDLDFGK